MPQNGSRLKDAVDDTMREDFDALKQDLTKLRGDVHNLVKDTAQLGKDSTHHLSDRAKEHGKQLADQLRHGRAKARKTIEAHPAACIGAAVGLGVIAGLMLRRSG